MLIQKYGIEVGGDDGPGKISAKKLLETYDAVFIGIGYASYLVCLELIVREVRAVRPSMPRWAVELSVHALCSLGIVLGRVTRLNSWDTVTTPRWTAERIFNTLTWRGAPLALGTGCDDFSPAAHALAEESRPGPVRDLRRLLTAAMRSEGFIVLDLEWWHFEWGTRRWAAIRGESTRYGPADPTTT